MLDEILKHKVPLAVTLAGLVIAFVFAIAPILPSDKEDQAAKAQAQQAQAQQAIEVSTARSDDIEARLSALEASFDGRLGSMELSINNLNKAAGQLARKINQLKADDDLATELADLKSQARNFEAQLVILNKATSRMHLRYVGLKGQSEEQAVQFADYDEVINGLRAAFAPRSN